MKEERHDTRSEMTEAEQEKARRVYARRRVRERNRVVNTRVQHRNRVANHGYHRCKERLEIGEAGAKDVKDASVKRGQGGSQKLKVEMNVAKDSSLSNFLVILMI